jgi:NAD(P)-dependent dehydrogenase (short-subunit alcohol dehydrogenase family)
MDVTIQKLFDLRGKTCLITGATGHLGAAMAAALAEAGASVIASSRKLPEAQRSIAALPVRHEGQKHYAAAIDQMEDETSIQRAFDRAVETAGQIDVLVNNGHELLGADWTSVSGEQFSRHLANATGYFLLARHLRNHAVARRAPASIIMLGSMYGLVGSYPDVYDDICAPSPVAYQTLKGGLIQMTRHLAAYWAKDGIRVNTLSPGPFPSSSADSRLLERLTKKTPLGRMGQSYELKGAIVFLASDASSFMTGQNLIIDGGWTAW